jgi:hypothetical protein
MRRHGFVLGPQYSIISFNYDRSLEQFLFQSIKAQFGLSDDEAGGFVAELDIVHLHGQLGNMPWQGGGSRGYNGTVGAAELHMCADAIRVVGPTPANDRRIQEVQEQIREAERVVFLGFGYDESNLARLGLRKELYKKNGSMRGTGLGLRRDTVRSLTEEWGIDVDVSGHDVHSYLENELVL